jgi:hypothetical protein
MRQYCINLRNRASTRRAGPTVSRRRPSPAGRTRRALFITAALVATLAVPAWAQQTATLKGRVLDDETGEAVAGAIVRVKGREPLTPDSLGRFRVSDLPAGPVEVAIQAIGYTPQTYKFSAVAGQEIDRIFPLQFSGTKLPELEVKARVQRLAPRYSEFERRRGLGMGAYFRWDEIKDRGFSSVGDALRSVRGVKIRCDQAAFECHAVMARTPQCFPTWWIDGVETRSFHENTPIRDIYGIEIYRGPGEVPADYGGSNAGCGTIVMWTKSRPYR